MEKFRAAWKYALSFLKKDWSINDYPIRIQEQAADLDGERLPRYSAQVINWWTLSGLGDTPEEALLDLERSLANFKHHNGYLHRPGKHVPIEFASADGIEAHAETAERFLTEVLDFSPEDPVFISDQSSLLDFEGLREGVDLAERVQEVFGVDVSDIEDGNLVRIFARIDGAA